jgi:hypothetical protein
VSNASGKLVILGILAVAVAAAGTSWWFRYRATHETAEFWGPEVTSLIRDAPSVELLRLAPEDTENSIGQFTTRNEEYAVMDRVDASNAPGILHLRNALLEDRSYHGYGMIFKLTPNFWRWSLVFRDGQKSATLLFNEECELTTLGEGSGSTANCKPIAAGLREMFAELSSPKETPAR